MQFANPEELHVHQKGEDGTSFELAYLKHNTIDPLEETFGKGTDAGKKSRAASLRVECPMEMHNPEFTVAAPREVKEKSGDANFNLSTALSCYEEARTALGGHPTGSKELQSVAKKNGWPVELAFASSDSQVPYPSLLVCKQSDNTSSLSAILPTHSIRPAVKEQCVSIFIDMAKDAETSKPKYLNPTSEYYLSSQANSGNSLTKDTLKGDNYVAWEQSAILTLKSHNKLTFIDGRITKSDPKSKDFLAWDSGGASVMTYYSKLLEMWDELLTSSPLESCGCPKGTEKMNWYQDLQTYQFLMGIDDKYATLCVLTL
ncbi:hypothetical protein RJ639_000534 [Escallonia herrerae]|uniref:Retrotransposon Copia-like N-terminal domain-containing protein n=1 Tax=Escallonia herrerae TaxID=1293975 RepID=A0AA88XSW2_9ASTE|nr:hypothetical protein RJ639_000534 [Escallonia herrerae]